MASKGTFTLQYTTHEDDFELEPGLTVRGAWQRYAHELGGNPDRPVVWRAGGILVSGDQQLTPGMHVVATVTQEAKG